MKATEEERKRVLCEMRGQRRRVKSGMRGGGECRGEKERIRGERNLSCLHPTDGQIQVSYVCSLRSMTRRHAALMKKAADREEQTRRTLEMRQDGRTKKRVPGITSTASRSCWRGFSGSFSLADSTTLENSGMGKMASDVRGMRI